MKDWTPDQKLRHDATDDQITARYHAEYMGRKALEQSIIDVARELAEAVRSTLSAGRSAQPHD